MNVDDEQPGVLHMEAVPAGMVAELEAQLAEAWGQWEPNPGGWPERTWLRKLATDIADAFVWSDGRWAIKAHGDFTYVYHCQEPTIAAARSEAELHMMGLRANIDPSYLLEVAAMGTSEGLRLTCEVIGDGFAGHEHHVGDGVYYDCEWEQARRSGAANG